ncbi:MAG: DUF4143 domain-containing protein [Actinomycetaceae bacterium]|nr:DUF4143 domain-containing protein [Actinomycetaceae bacterium]
MGAYLERCVDKNVEDTLGVMGAVLLQGCRACGKTSTGLHHAQSDVRFDESPQMIELAELNPGQVLQGETPRLIDEWQLAPRIWNAMRHEVDRRQAKGQFILSGSALPADDVTRHSGAGRVARIHMRPMSLAESGSSSGVVSLRKLFYGQGGEYGEGTGLMVDGMQGEFQPPHQHQNKVSARSDLGYEDIAQAACFGGWPALIGATQADVRIYLQSYIDELTHTDIPTATTTTHKPRRLLRLMQAIARNIATEVAVSTLAAEVGHDGANTTPATARDYMDAMSQVFILEEQPAWATHLRSRSRLRQTAKLHFVDPSLACAVLGVEASRLSADPEYFGFVFESMVVRDLRIYASGFGGQVFHYRDNTGLEIDAIIETWDGRWAGIEVKLGANRVAQGEAALLKLARERVDITRIGEPAFLAVITGSEYAYTLPSGVHVIPLATLGA